MKKEYRPESQRLFKLSHQILCITGINFENKSLIGYVELTVWPLRGDLTSIRINSKQSSIFKVTVDRKWEAEYTYFDPLLDICQGNAVKRNLDYFEKCHQNGLSTCDADQGSGELIITLPSQVLPTVSALGCLQICVEFGLENPQCGLHFIVPDTPGTMAQRSAHCYTQSTENFARTWFPCFDTFSEPCTWKVEVTVDRDMTAVSCGDLVSVEYTEDMMHKVYHYFLSSPTAAPNIALAVGPFEILVDPKMHEVTHFCLPRLLPVLKHTTGYIHQAFEFYEELMSSRYPYSYYKQVFVDEAYDDVTTYATMSILSVSLLHPPHIIDQTMASRLLMATAVAQQFFGSFMAMQSWFDAWLTKGITGYLSYLFCKRTFGNNEYRNMVMKDQQEVSQFEQASGLIVLDPSKRDSNHTFSIRSPHSLSPAYAEIFAKKARLVMRMLEIRLGTELFLQVLNKLLSLAYNASQQAFSLTGWSNMLLSTSSFLKIIYTVTGKDIEPFIDQWVTQGGCARFNGSFVFNRKRNVVELEIKQDLMTQGALKFAGALNVTIQELDGSFNHTFKIEENKTKFEITCHSKSRRNKKKKIPLMTGEEVDMDLSIMDQDSPVLWLRLDPDMHLLRTVHLEQADYMWQYQLKYERCIVAQFESIEALGRYATPASRYALTDTIENEECYYKVRQEACYCLAKVANQMVGSWTGPPAMMAIFRKMFGSHSCPFILRQNNFSNFHHYYLLKTMPQAMARLRDTHSLCLAEVTKFLLDLFKYNDNSRNKWADNYFRSALVEALAASITPAVTNVSLITGRVATAETLSPETRLVVGEVVRALNLDKLMPSYRNTVTCSCLYAVRTLQKYGHLPNDSDVFKDYAQVGVFRDARAAALTCLVDFIRGDISGGHLTWTLDFIQEEPDPYLKHHAVTCLTKNPPFRLSERSPLNTEPLVERLWVALTSELDCRMRAGLAQLYCVLYGRQRPSCLPVPELVKQAHRERKARQASMEANQETSLLEAELLGQPAHPTKSIEATTEAAKPASLHTSTVWNTDLASMFAVAPSDILGHPSSSLPAEILEDEFVQDETMVVSPVAREEVLGGPIKVDLDSVVADTSQPDLGMPGEQGVLVEEEIVTEVVAEESVVSLTLPMPDISEAHETSVDQTNIHNESISDEFVEVSVTREETILSAPPDLSSPPALPKELTADVKHDVTVDDSKPMFSPGGQDDDSMSPPKLSPSPSPGPPEDVVVSLDNVIRNPAMPAGIFASPPHRGRDSERRHSGHIDMDVGERRHSGHIDLDAGERRHSGHMDMDVGERRHSGHMDIDVGERRHSGHMDIDVGERRHSGHIDIDVGERRHSGRLSLSDREETAYRSSSEDKLDPVFWSPTQDKKETFHRRPSTDIQEISYGKPPGEKPETSYRRKSKDNIETGSRVLSEHSQGSAYRRHSEDTQEQSHMTPSDDAQETAFRRPSEDKQETAHRRPSEDKKEPVFWRPTEEMNTPTRRPSEDRPEKRRLSDEQSTSSDKDKKFRLDQPVDKIDFGNKLKQEFEFQKRFSAEQPEIDSRTNSELDLTSVKPELLSEPIASRVSSPMFSPQSSPLMSDEIEVCDVLSPKPVKPEPIAELSVVEPPISQPTASSASSSSSMFGTKSSSLLLQHLQAPTTLSNTKPTTPAPTTQASLSVPPFRISTLKAEVKEEEEEEMPILSPATPLPSLKTTINLGGLTPSVGDSSRSSHHKSKKKKKKHKKHKHKHKHDKGDRDPPADQPRERLVLNMSLKGLKGAAAREASDDDTDSELEV